MLGVAPPVASALLWSALRSDAAVLHESFAVQHSALARAQELSRMPESCQPSQSAKISEEGAAYRSLPSETFAVVTLRSWPEPTAGSSDKAQPAQEGTSHSPGGRRSETGPRYYRERSAVSAHLKEAPGLTDHVVEELEQVDFRHFSRELLPFGPLPFASRQYNCLLSSALALEHPPRANCQRNEAPAPATVSLKAAIWSE